MYTVFDDNFSYFSSKHVVTPHRDGSGEGSQHVFIQN